MSTKALKCPNCGAEVLFSSPGTIVVVCTHCNWASFRRDVELESIGKVAMPAALESHFRLGTRGAFEGQAFEVRGQLQLDHGAGIWNEWCAATEDGGWLWITEAQGRLGVLSECRPSDPLPEPGKLAAGWRVRLDGGAPFVVHELGEGTVISAAGELPIALALGARTRYVDLSRPDNGIATIDWTRDPPEVFVGRTVELAELGLDAATRAEPKPVRVGATRIDCQNCGAGIDLFDPRNARTVACPACNAILDPQSKKLVAKQAEERLRTGPRIRLGLTTRWRGEDVQVLGFLRRSVKVEGVEYPWSEYLLRTSMGEYRWLVENKGHWIHAKPIEPGEAERRGPNAFFRGLVFKHFDGGKARVRAVLGEFYWQVRVGDEVEVDDFVLDEKMLSFEREEKELAVSYSVHVEAADVARAFRIEKPPRPSGVGALAPNPWPSPLAWGAFLVAWLALLGAHLVHRAGCEKREVLAATFGPPTSAVEEKVDFSEPFELSAANANLRVALSVPALDNGWLGLAGALVNETTGAVTSFGLATESYHGITDGEAWSEGRRETTAWIGPVPAGRYRMRLASVGFEGGIGKPYSLRATSDVPRIAFVGWSSLLLLLLPLATSAGAVLFEKRRWDASAHPWGEG